MRSFHHVAMSGEGSAYRLKENPYQNPNQLPDLRIPASKSGDATQWQNIWSVQGLAPGTDK